MTEWQVACPGSTLGDRDVFSGVARDADHLVERIASRLQTTTRSPSALNALALGS